MAHVSTGQIAPQPPHRLCQSARTYATRCPPKSEIQTSDVRSRAGVPTGWGRRVDTGVAAYVPASQFLLNTRRTVVNLQEPHEFRASCALAVTDATRIAHFEVPLFCDCATLS